jgi:hypothetical protein
MPQPRLHHRQVLDLISQLSQIFPNDTAERGELYMLLAAWFEGICEDPIRQEQWLRWGRERRTTRSLAR